MKTLTLLATVALASVAPAQEITVTRANPAPTQPAPAENFTGNVRIERLFGAADPSRMTGGLVTFAAGARTAWHTHPLGQTLIVTAGLGRVQSWGGAIQEIRPGDVVRIPPNVKHWHGASPQAAMTHVALGEQHNGKSVDWLEPLTDEQFNAPLPDAPVPVTTGPSRAQQLVGDVAPKLAELTDEVLFGDVWARPQLSRRDRSLVTVSALIAMNRPDQLRSHLALAKQNGVTEEELSEAITHLAFYAGWPSAMSAAGVAKEVFRRQ